MHIRGLLLDVEGVLVADKRYTAVPTATDFITRARAARLPLRLITNNTTDDKPAIVEKLRRAGFDFSLGELHTCTSAAVNHLRTLGARRCFVMGNAALRDIFRQAGFDVVDAADVDAVVVGLDLDFNYERLTTACEAIFARKAAFIALHRNRLYPDALGRVAPSVGALVAAVEYATQVEPTVIGKPSPAYFRQALDELGLPPTDVLVISDDPLSDLAGAKRMGMQAALVLSGKYPTASILEKLPPNERADVTAPRIGDLLTSGAISLA
jgi:HAD superfamily hydrolase (TIGR01458 family)